MIRNIATQFQTKFGRQPPLCRKGKTRQYNEYFLNGSVLPVIETEKDLGVHVTNDLKWDYHISQSLSKAKQCVGWVSRSVISREKAVMLNIYKSLVRPNLEYCVQLCM